MTKFLLPLFFLIFISTNSFSQLYINEFMASNASTIQDPDYAGDADWIEIYNDGNSAVNLNGYFLTDNVNIPNKWVIGDVTIEAKGYVIFWADGNSIGNHTNFKLDAQAEQLGFFKPDLSLIDSISYINQQPDISSGRNINDLSVWGHFAKATPNAANTTEFFSDFALNTPEFSLRGGMYNNAQSLTLFTDLGGDIRYTLDGSEPTLTSTLYTQAIPLNTTTVVRARIFKPDMLPGAVVTNTYFFDANIQTGGLAVVSLSSNPENFWDATKGIYVQTFKPDWEIPVNIELFENNGADRAAFNEIAGVKINGLYSWQLPQKMLGVYFKKRYGSGTLDHTLFYDSPRSGFKTFAIRASGNDWSNTLMRDILGQNATQLNMNLDLSAWRWCSVYFNGQYMGIHNFREKIETDYIEKHYGLAAGTFDMVENQDFAECGDLTAYNELMTAFAKDLSIQANFDTVATKMDVENFTDLVITEMAVANSSIDHNVMAWKPKGSGKWRWIVMDLDRGFFDSTGDVVSFYTGQTSFPFSNLMKNAAYKSYMGKRLADHLYTTFNPQTMQDLVQKHRTEIAPEMTRHVNRWLGTTSDYGDAMPSVDFWENEIEVINTFVRERPIALLNDLSKYGFSGTALLNLSVYPENAGTLKLNNFKIAQNYNSAPYLKNLSSQITAEEKAGYTFKGWATSTKTVLVSKQAEWKYLDAGTDEGIEWKETTFDDTAWKSGQAELGYGESDQVTTIGYGTSTNKYTTSYFRHSFTVTEADLNGNEYWLNLLRDDGAVVYLNGVEIIRDNIKPGVFNYKTLANSTTSAICEKTFFPFQIDKKNLKLGVNVIAVEVHQVDATSSDLSFNLELAYYKPESTYLSTEKNYNIQLTGDLALTAVYEQTSACVVPQIISENTTLYKSCSPYVLRDDVTVKSGVTLTIEPGVQILMSLQSNVFIHGNINAQGTVNDSIILKINPLYAGKGWGALNFWNCSATSNLSYVRIDDATRGPVPQRIGAISTFYGNLNLDHIVIDNTILNPISARYSDIVLTNSYIHSKVTSDLLNIKYGHARIENCTFVGNPEFDSDGIDYDGIENGVIRNTKLYNILGNNGDAIDIGEEARNVIIDSVVIVNASDKGISIGQRSSVVLTNSVLVNCNMGAGVKDSSSISIDHVIFYGNGSAVSCYEKNPGRAGGNAKIYNSILSNSYAASYEVDNKSTIHFSNSLSDNDVLPGATSNQFGNPLFVNPTLYDFHSTSDNVLNAGIGTKYSPIYMQPDAMICGIFMNPLNSTRPEYLLIINPSNQTLDLSNYTINKGVNCIIPAGTLLAPSDTLIVTSNTALWDASIKTVQWTDGKLSNEGEAIQLLNQYGLVADYVRYNPAEWPIEAFVTESLLSLKAVNLDNHFAQNWEAKALINGIYDTQDTQSNELIVFPNPVADKLTIKGSFEKDSSVDLYSISGQLVRCFKVTEAGNAGFIVADVPEGTYVIKAGTQAALVLIKR